MTTTRKRRLRITAWQREQIKEHYQNLRTHEDKARFCLQIEIVDADENADVEKLYNIAHRLGVSGKKNFAAIVADETLLRERDDPNEVIFSAEQDAYIRREWGRTPVAAIARHVGLTEITAAYRARVLGVRHVAWYWDARKVASWLGMTVEELRGLESEGVICHALLDSRQQLRSELVATSALNRWIHEPGNRGRLLAAGADEFFLREVEESQAALAARQDRTEACRYLLHGHTCGNPRTVCLGRFCPAWERWGGIAGGDPRCRAKSLRLSDLKRADDEADSLLDD